MQKLLACHVILHCTNRIATIDFIKVVEKSGHPDFPPVRSHRAQLRQWAQDRVVHFSEREAILFTYVTAIHWGSDDLVACRWKGSFCPGSFPRRALPRVLGTMTHLTTWQSFWLPRFYTCQPILSIERIVRFSHVYRLTLMTCRALWPRGCLIPLPSSGASDSAFGN